MTQSKLPEAEAVANVWAAIKAQPIAMFTTLHEGEMVSRPMAAHADPDTGLLYFVSQLESLKTHDIQDDASVNLAFVNADRSTWISVVGTARVSQDRAKLRELWNMWAEAWLPDGPDAPDTALITVNPKDAVIWDNHMSGVVRLVKTATAAITQSPPDMGVVQKVQL